MSEASSHDKKRRKIDIADFFREAYDPNSIEDAERAIDERRDIVVSGAAGTGKSTFIRKISQKHSGNKKMGVIVTATTANAADVIGGKTIHSAFQLPLDFQKLGPRELRQLASRKRKDLAKILQSKRLVIIDEMSMMSGTFYYNLREYLKFICPDKQFQYVLCGDFNQLPTFNPADTLYSRPTFEMDHEIFFLIKVYRQKNLDFAIWLNNIAYGVVDDPPKEVTFFVEDTYDESIPRIYGTNHEVTYHNNRMYMNLTSKDERTFKSTLISWEVKFPRDCPTKEVFMLQFPEVRVKVGSVISITKNTKNKKLFNGKRLKIEGFDPETGVPVGRCIKTGEVFVINYHDLHIEVKEFNASVQMMPLTLAWAFTVNKAQGQTFDKVVVCPKQFRYPAQTYTALTRASCPEGLYIGCPRHILAHRVQPVTKAISWQARQDGHSRRVLVSDS